MKAGKYDITIEQGAGFSLPMTYTADGQAVDLSGCTARMQVREKVGSAVKLIELSTANGGIALGGTAGTITLSMTSAATAVLKFGRAVYDLEIVPSGAEPYRLLEGCLSLSTLATSTLRGARRMTCGWLSKASAGRSFACRKTVQTGEQSGRRPWMRVYF